MIRALFHPYSGANASCVSRRGLSKLLVSLLLMACAAVNTALSAAQDGIKHKAEQLLNQRVAELLAQLQSNESALRMDVAADPMVRALALVDEQGELVYPQPGNIVHISEQTALDDQVRLRQLAGQLQQQDTVWGRRDFNANELYFCTPAEFRVCLIIVSEPLASALGTNKKTLLARLDQPQSSAGSGWLWVALLLCLPAIMVIGFAASKRYLTSGTASLSTTSSSQPVEGGFTMADMLVQPALKLARRGSDKVAITERDLVILTYLHQRPNQVISKDELYDAAWGRDFVPSSRALEQHIINLRRKLDPNKQLPAIIETVHGQGYRYPC